MNDKSRAIGIFGASALVMGNMAGSGVITMPADLSHYSHAAVIIGLLITTIGAICLALTFVDLNRWIPVSGGLHIYAHRVFGDFAGFQMAWGYWIFSWASNAALCITASRYLSAFYPILEQQKIYAFIFEMVLLWGITGFNLLSTRFFNILQITITICKMGPLLLFAIIGILYFPGLAVEMISSPIASNSLSFFTQISIVISMTLWAFIGIESAIIPSDKISNPQKTIRLGTIIGVLSCAVIYLFSTSGIFVIVPNEILQSSSAPYVDASRIMFGNVFSNIIGTVLVIGIIFTLNGWILIQGQIPYSMAKENLLPSIFKKTNKNGAPYFALCTGSALISILLYCRYDKSFQDQFIWAELLSTFTIVVPYLYSSVAALCIGYSRKEMHWGKFIMYITGICYSILAIIGMRYEIIAIGAIMTFCIGVPIYAFVKRDEKI